MAFEPSDSLRSRTYIGLILAQFLAAFNDQAIHASTMFYAINHGTMRQATAISLMPILFFAPWAVFCTLAGFLADRYSKRNSLIAWKVAEIGITLVALAGFWFGTAQHHPKVGTVILLATVFLMGTHSAFFVPAKYGAMPEILQPQLLSRGNGILESTSFLAVILGTVGGGILSFVFRNQEYWIGCILVGLAMLGVVFSLLIQRMPAANSTRTFPVRNPFLPLVDNLRLLLRSRPLALAVLGIAFFTFMVAFMRATMYMHGESQNPRWDEFQTSLIVATVALGVGLGSPLAGYLSGGKVELGLVPLGAVGMVVATLVAAYAIFWLFGLVVALVLIGFFSGFYIVPLYTLLQHRAPKTSKGDLIATSNFINVTGAIAASLLFFVLVAAAKWTGVARSIPQEEVATGELAGLRWEQKRWLGLHWHGSHPRYFEVRDPASGKAILRVGQREAHADDGEDDATFLPAAGKPHQEIPELADDNLQNGDSVRVSRYILRGTDYYEARPAADPLLDAYDQELVPRYLFMGASAMTLGILLLLCRQLPDFFVRALLWLRSHGRFRLKVSGLNHLPSDGPVILATDCDRFQECMQVVAATDRYTRFILWESAADDEPRPLLRYLARRTGLVALRPETMTPALWDKALAKATQALATGNLLGVTADSTEAPVEVEAFLRELQIRQPVSILPVHCDIAPPSANGSVAPRRVRVAIGAPLPSGTSPDAVRYAIRALADSVRQGSLADSTIH